MNLIVRNNANNAITACDDPSAFVAEAARPVVSVMWRCRSVLAHPTNKAERSALINLIGTMLRAAGVEDYMVICDDSNNPPDAANDYTKVSIGWNPNDDAGHFEMTFWAWSA